jgi:hypothetical protein
MKGQERRADVWKRLETICSYFIHTKEFVMRRMHFTVLVLIVAASVVVACSKTALATPPGGKGGTGPKPTMNKPPSNIPSKPHPHPHPHPRPVYDGGYTAPWQTVRYLQIDNQSGETLTIYVKLDTDGPTYSWTFAPGFRAYLAIDNEKIAAAEVFIWATGGGKQWTSGQNGLTLVSEPYRSSNIGTFTYTFNP